MNRETAITVLVVAVLVGGVVVMVRRARKRRVTPAENEVVHVVVGGDTLGKLARTYGTTVWALVSRNGIADPDRIEVGQRIIITSST